MALVLQIARRLTLTAYSLPSASAEEVGFYLQPKPISFGICSRFVSASSKLKSVAFPFGYQRPADGDNNEPIVRHYQELLVRKFCDLLTLRNMILIYKEIYFCKCCG